ncbi:MAG: hypothetical protein GX915_06235 [Clostridiales bacterium]|nr:hypothetical protein [Clostridiales bacterium]
MIRRIALRDTINDSLICLSKTQEAMIDTIDTVQQWEVNHKLVEKLAFDIVNNTDRALKLSRDGHNLVDQLNHTCKSVLEKPNNDNLEQLNKVIKEVIVNFQSIQYVEKVSSDIAHELENGIAIQGNIGLDIKDSLEHVGVHLNQTVACTELDWM